MPEIWEERLFSSEDQLQKCSVWRIIPVTERNVFHKFSENDCQSPCAGHLHSLSGCFQARHRHILPFEDYMKATRDKLSKKMYTKPEPT